MPFDWRKFHATNTRSPAVVDPRWRMTIVFCCVVAAMLAVFARAVQLEAVHGEAFRREALRPIEREIVLPAGRGRILDRNGSVLARDREIEALAVEYRLLQNPPDERWMRRAIRSRLPKSDRNDVEKAAVARAKILAERAEYADKLARLCGLAADQWAARAEKIQDRVERIAENVNRRATDQAARPRETDGSWTARLYDLLIDDPPPERIVVKEELQRHVMAEDIPAESAAEIETNPDDYPGAKIERVIRRCHEQGESAAHVVGYLGHGDDGETVGLSGVERQYESVLRGRDGAATELIDRGRRLISSQVTRHPQPGRDIVLAIDLPLQRTVESLLRDAIKRAIKTPDPFMRGGAVAVMDVESGELLVAASAPAFDPNLFAAGDDDALKALLADESHPLFNRVAQMAIPPGSTFKIVTAAALLESATVGPGEPLDCRGYLHTPDRMRCELFVRRGEGHGTVTLPDALAVSCNVYFFHFVEQLGDRPLLELAERFGFGRPTGIDLPSEARGNLPTPENLAELQFISVGQGKLTATPLQVLRMVAAVANGGRLVEPSLVKRGEGRRENESGEGVLSQATVKAIRRGLERVVADPRGTAHGTVHIESIPIAGKTGTAETGEDSPSHAWFAGYIPADKPKYAFVIALEHAGNASSSAGPVAKRLVLRMKELGML